MTLHLIKLCVGVASVEELRSWQSWRVREGSLAGFPRPPFHTTRMVPRRREELLNGGSLYWVIQGLTCVRQRLEEIRPFVDYEGIGRCHLLLGRELVAVEPVPRRPFQGWRYLSGQDAPQDCQTGRRGDDGLQGELARLGL